MGDRRAEPPRDTGLYTAETVVEVNGLRVRCTGDEAALLHMAVLAGALDAEKLKARAEEHAY